MNSRLLLVFFLHYADAITVGLIRNVSLTLLTSSFSSTMHGTSEQCVCTMITSPNISVLNYFSNNTCQLFSNVSLANAYLSWMPSVDSLFYFLYLPTGLTPTTQDTPGSTVSMESSIRSTEYKLTISDATSTDVRTSTDLITSTMSRKTSAFSTMTAAHTTAPVILPYTVAGTGTAGSQMSQFNEPNDIFITTNGTLYVADYNNNRVQIFKPNNTTASFSQTGMVRPLTVCLDNVSNYYVSEYVGTSYNRLSKWPSNQTILTLTGVYGLALDSRRNLYLSTLLNTIIFWNATSNTNTTIVSTSFGLCYPRHIHLDEENRALYIADTCNHRIVKFHLNTGNFTVVAGGKGAGHAANQLTNCAGVCVSKQDGTIYVADTDNNRVQKWVVNATVGITIIGNANGTSGNGIQELNGPYSVALNPDETFLYIADSHNNRVQRISLN